MKRLLFLLLMTFAAVPTFAQLLELHAQPDRTDDTIVLALPDEGQVAWKRAAAVLVARGYTLRHSDAELLTLSTDLTNLESNPIMSIFVHVTGHQLLLRGRCIMSTNLTDVPQVVRRGGFLGGINTEWLELEAIAQTLGGTATYYNSAAR
ncbi:hypothetical protein [Hymenobacter terrestris]|uniref:Uncharacterized protein n=1 Tax=Hymenobacter terrestris TaxID=2748310 RepID=A0ABX2Q278_9BACT|nr:hypothetical protein [Hymenobacter terrestris]NVO85060.1 hypothetical protein [Hymenobacter terrestris]